MLRRLPPEIVQIIREFSADSLLWRFGLALGFFQRLSSSTPGDLVSMPLSDCLTWERDSLSAPTVCSESRPEFIRLTIDSFGIKRIERLASVPPYNPQPSERLRFMTITETQASDVVTHFKFGALRLEFPDVNYTFPTWDTESCPPLNDRIALFRQHSSLFAGHYRTINLRKITGITFFFEQGNIFNIHAHTANAPTAIKTWKRLDSHHRRSAAWIYMPVSPNDDVIAFGPSVEALNRDKADDSDEDDGAGFCFLFRFQLAGDVVVGRYPENSQDFALTELPIASLIYNNPQHEALSLIAAVLEDTVKPLRVVPFSPWPGPNRLSYYSSASLRNVNHVLVFNNPYTGFCRGILLDYENGAKRALGQCRVGIDSATAYSRPTHFCFRREAYSPSESGYWIRTISFECTDKGDHHHEDEDWICHSTPYEVDFWFDSEDVNISIYTDE
ncbi:hypothetical protein F4806DRAFT_431498 [Annulohypoxylon nitens]|nr:hypothetical protein F4806DRAFT_431498 [Annulohypoxylon nitens]